MAFPLPEAFLSRMQQLLPEKSEYESFIQSYDKDHYQALRINPLKGDAGTLFSHLGCTLTPVPWCSTGFYYPQELHPGKSPYHEAGAYYIQEPSAMAPAAYLDAQPGEKILDLCAAPGGKSTQIAGAMRGQGLLISNEIHPARARILSENIERMGISNAIVTNMAPAELSAHFPLFFDRIMVDAPCSGEGMFRKNEQACEEWSPENVQICAARQQEILACAASMLRPGGRMVYSTCTFAPEENEGTISRFLEQHPQFHIVPVKKYPGMADGVAAWTKHPAAEIGDTIRLFPHHLHGEGHFVAVLEKEGTVSQNYRGYCANGEEKPLAKGEAKAYLAGLQEFLGKIPADDAGRLFLFGEQLYLMPEHMPATRRLHVLRPGLHLGTVKKNRLEPAHALALAISPQEACHSWNLSVDEARAYLAGQTFPAEGEKGWYLITVDGYSLGWGKLAGSVMKNHYPKGLRKLL